MKGIKQKSVKALWILFLETINKRVKFSLYNREMGLGILGYHFPVQLFDDI